MKEPEKETDAKNSEREFPSVALMGAVVHTPPWFPFVRKPKDPKKPPQRKK